MAQTAPAQQIPPGMGKTEEWKTQLKAPTKDTRIKTEVRYQAWQHVPAITGRVEHC